MPRPFGGRLVAEPGVLAFGVLPGRSLPRGGRLFGLDRLDAPSRRRHRRSIADRSLCAPRAARREWPVGGSGALGVIGPTRLNYARIVPMVDYTAQLISRMLR